jgi:hypothetical protein
MADLNEKDHKSTIKSDNQEEGNKQSDITAQKSEAFKTATDPEIEKIEKAIALLKKQNELAQLEAQSEVQKIKKEAVENNKENLKASLKESLEAGNSAGYILSEFNPQATEREQRLHSSLSHFNSIQDRLVSIGGEIKEPQKLDPYQIIPGAQTLGKQYNIFGEYASELSVLFDAPPIFKEFYLLEFKPEKAKISTQKKELVLDNELTLLPGIQVSCERVNQHRFLCPKNIKVVHLSKTVGGYHEVEHATEYSSTLQTANDMNVGASFPAGSFAGSVKKELNMSYTEASASKVSCKHTHIDLYGLKLAIILPKYEVESGKNEDFVRVLDRLKRSFKEKISARNVELKKVFESIEVLKNKNSEEEIEENLKYVQSENLTGSGIHKIDNIIEEYRDEVFEIISDFFDVYSPYFVGGIVMGGRSSIVTTYKRDTNVKENEAREQTEIAMSLIMEDVAANSGVKEAAKKTDIKAKLNSQFKVNYIFVGGDAQYGSCALEKGYARWATSVYQEPVFVNFLPDGLIPIWELLPKNETSLKDTMKRASKKWYEEKYLEKVAEEVNKIKEEREWQVLVKRVSTSVTQARVAT